MNNKNIKAITRMMLIGIVCGLTLSVSAQTTAVDMAKKMQKGINLGNTFDAHQFEGAWAPAAKESDMEAFHKAGFTCVRIPVTWHSGLSATDSTLRFDLNKPYKVNDAFFARLDEVVNWALSRGMVAIINVHHDSWLKNQNTFESQKERFYTLWEQIALHYAKYPENLLFEILNEPHHETNGIQDGLTQEQVDGLNKQALSIIRKTNKTRVTIYMGPIWGGQDALLKSKVPDSTDKYLIGSYHSYSPWSYAGEANGIWGTADDKAGMDNEFKNLKTFRDSTKIPVFIGEYGAQQQCEYNSRMKHYAYYVENIQKSGAASAAWDDCGFLFKIYDRNTGVWDDTKDIIINYTPQSPNDLTLSIADGLVVNLKWANRAENVTGITVERRVGRKGAFEKLETVGACNTYADKTPKDTQTQYYYRIVNHLSDSTILYSYPQFTYIP